MSHYIYTREKHALWVVFPDIAKKLSKLLVILCRDLLLLAFPHLLEKGIESGKYVWFLCLIYGVHYLTFGEGQYINNFWLYLVG